jgi:hypothetical protein
MPLPLQIPGFEGAVASGLESPRIDPKRPAITVRALTKLPSTRICARLIVKSVKLARSAAK